MPTLAFDPDALRRIRQERGVTQWDLAGALGVTVPTVCRYETRASTPSMYVIDLMAQALGGEFREREVAAHTTAARTAQADADELKPCECAAYDALLADLTEEQVASGDYEVFTDGVYGHHQAPGRPWSRRQAQVRADPLGCPQPGHLVQRGRGPPAPAPTCTPPATPRGR
jgi:transcriptional regulator with XRE-family HTH domain